ncbi:MFS transporter [Pseudonocardia acaciae]|uniref:MFS transporter n=1 Tax=Pseudonocardia acaciae TaxID=551276 RepID=UPI00068759DD|nr:MFS transporter [Pseudonocardia acaciae]
MTGSPNQDAPTTKWFMLAIVSLGFVTMSANWFNVSTGFGPIAREFGLDIPDVAFLISIFVFAYGLLHIPGGFLATRWGLRPILALGLGIEGIGSMLSAAAGSFAQLASFRALCGVGASVFAAVGIAAVSVWFRHRHHALALGVSSAGFSVGTAVGLYLWADLTAATSWRTSLLLGGALQLAVAVITAIGYRVPGGLDALRGARLTRQGLRHTLGNRDIWLFGCGFLGAYGAYLGASQLIAGYGEHRGFGATEVAVAAFLVGIAGVPGSVLSGWVADRYLSPRVLFLVGAVLEGVFLLVLPVSGPGTFWIPALGIGFMFNGTFAIWQTIPGGLARIAPEHIGTAVGLMLTISAVGGFAVPWAFGLIVPAGGYPAGWLFMGVTSILAALASLLAGRPPAGTPTPARLGRARR